jgi:hypothetical protein
MTDKRIILTTEILVLGKLPNDIFDYMLNLDKEKYLKWHEKDHLDYKLVKQTTDTLGSIFYFDENIGGKLRTNYNWELVELETNKKLRMKAQYFIPIYLLLTFDKQTNGTLVTHELKIGYKKNKALNWLIKKIKFGSKNKILVHEHAIEEFKNLEHLITKNLN